MRGNKLKSLRFESRSNVWQVGLIMHQMMKCKTLIDWDDWQAYPSTLIDFLKGKGETLGDASDYAREMKDPNISPSAYSVRLRGLIHSCLLIQQESRPTPYDLVASTTKGLNSARVAAQQILTPPTYLPAAQPRNPAPDRGQQPIYPQPQFQPYPPMPEQAQQQPVWPQPPAQPSLPQVIAVSNMFSNSYRALQT